MKIIKLTQEKYALVDDIDFDFLNQFKWYYAKTGKSKKGYAFSTSLKAISGRRITSMHRLLLSLSDSRKHTDHIDSDGLNNQRSNLRVCRQAQNNCNQKINRLNTSGYKGVSWCKKKGEWRAYIVVNNKQKHLGYYEIKEEAANAYNHAAKTHFGEFARLNEI